MKAQNILITGRWAKITDVGVARVMAAPAQADVAITLGTFAYAAPEMLLGGDWDIKADIYRWASFRSDAVRPGAADVAPRPPAPGGSAAASVLAVPERVFVRADWRESRGAG